MGEATTTALPDERVAAPAASVARLWRDRVTASPDREAFRYRDAAKTWQSLTWAQADARVTALAAGLLDLGVGRGERVGIISGTRLEWILVDTAILCAGAATTAVYPSSPAPDVAFILADAGCRVVVLENADQLEKVRAHRGELPRLEKVVLLDGPGPAPGPGPGPGPGTGTGAGEGDPVLHGVETLSLSDLEARGQRRLSSTPRLVGAIADELGPDDLATLIYTSGTTGRPKGVRLTHRCWTYEAAAIDALHILHETDVQYLWLPLAHSFGKVLTCAHIGIGFVTAVDGSIPDLVDNLAVVRPTFMAAAPRIFEKVHNRVVGAVREEGGLRLRIFGWALGVGRTMSRLRREGRGAGPLLRAQYAVADRLVFAKVRARFGGRIRYFVSGSAALSPQIAEFFHAMGILVLEGYGLTETSGSIFVNRPTKYRFGTIGLPLPGMEAKIAQDGELLVRGPAVMSGYHVGDSPDRDSPPLPDVFTPDGWLKTGDVGEIEDGLVRITDRKKDVFKTSGGKYVAPQPAETRFKALCRYASQIVISGEGRNFCTALIALDEDEIQAWAERNGVAGSTYAEIVGRPETRELIQGYVDKLNATLARWETIKKFVLLPRDLDVDHGELTPSLKVRRRVVEREYADELDELYADAVAEV